MRARIAEPTKVEEILGGRHDGAYNVEAIAPCCGAKVIHIMEFRDHGPSHRVCNAQCGGSYEVVRPRFGEGLLPYGEDRFWESRQPRFGGLAGLGGVTGLAAADLSGPGLLIGEGV